MIVHFKLHRKSTSMCAAITFWSASIGREVSFQLAIQGVGEYKQIPIKGGSKRAKALAVPFGIAFNI